MSSSPSPAVRARRRRLVRSLLILLVLVLVAALGLGTWRLVAGGSAETSDPAAGSSTNPTDSSTDAAAGSPSSSASGTADAGDGATEAAASASGGASSTPSADAPASSASRDADSIHVLVNRRNPLKPQDYAPQVRALDVPMVYAGQEMRPRAADALEALFADAQQRGHALKVTTAYRTFGHQKALYDQRLEASGRTVADEYTARPGYSEHQTGLAVDVTADHDCTLKGCFGDTPEGKWLAQHAPQHGFIIRYPEGASDITGYSYEPWHLRYVGKKTARAVHEAGVTLEEYWGEPAAAEYPDAAGTGR